MCIRDRLEGIFRGAGWNVLKVIWGSYWDQLLAKDKTGLLVKRMNEAVDGEYQLDAGDKGYQHYTITVPLSFVGLPIDYQYQTWTGEAITGHNHELHYGMTVSGVDVGLMVGRNIDTSHAAGLTDNDDSTYANFTLGYSF